MRIELTRVGLLIYLANHYTTRGVYICVCVCVGQVSMCGCVYLSVSLSVCLWVCTRMCLWLHMCAYASVCVCVCACVCVCVCVCVCARTRSRICIRVWSKDIQIVDIWNINLTHSAIWWKERRSKFSTFVDDVSQRCQDLISIIWLCLSKSFRCNTLLNYRCV